MQKNGEFDRIERLARILGAPSKRVAVGIGDDTAVVESPKDRLLFCSDAMVEGVHFDLAFTSARALGHKALAAVLSDIAAMGGRPLYALTSIAMPSRLESKFLEEFYVGLGHLARQWSVDVVGGDLASSKQDLFIDISVIGEAQAPILRSGARPGDLVAVSGHLGSSAAGLHALRTQRSGEFPELVHAHLEPQPRFDLLDPLRQTPGLATAMIDISDGLSSELHHLAKSSNLGFSITAAEIPLAEDAIRLGGSHAQALDWALNGGEDYQLLITLDPELKAQHGTPPGFHIIGHATEARDIMLIDFDGRKSSLEAKGFNHFA